MAQAATMGPPLSPREPRRSGRRSAPFPSTASKSPDSDPAPRQKDLPIRPAFVSNNSSSRTKRPKQEDQDDSIEDRKSNHSHSSATPNGRSKRKPREKDKQVAIIDSTPDAAAQQPDDVQADPAEDEEQGITRCVCGSTEDDPDAGEFMVQCETCKVWQHGLCMGYQSEDQVHDDDYYCEQCRPELHTELLKKLAKRPRHPSTNSHAPASRVSRSHSPAHVKQPSKRRNTMNSRDAAFDESIKEVMEVSAAEAAAAAQEGVNTQPTSNPGGRNEPVEEEVDTPPSNRKKRKRTEDDGAPKKRTRSASTASDHQGSTVARAETPINGVQTKPAPAPPPKASSGRNKRGGRRLPPPLEAVNQEGEEALASVVPPSRRSGGNRSKGSGAAKRAPASSHGPGSALHEHGTRRSNTNGPNGQNPGSTSAEASRAYRNSHAYVVSQQPLFTSWGLPDYLAHLEEMLPTDTPQPLEVRAGPANASVGGAGRESIERTMERGVKVKWPSKRMSVGDMNKRVRALVEWVGREQANALDRSRRREALESTLKEEPTVSERVNSTRGHSVPEVDMVIDGQEGASEEPKTSIQKLKHGTDFASPIRGLDVSKSLETMKMMEELMEELINFQERFGPGAKNRERRTATAS
ncbi:hypothetical protein AMATHDRAFT_58952 [Amanita thiersii Skay4041]|uniref:PHD-type domain-containing protein n=1 Tax=Amanita thiersii Skay4041 TaxID=703135 RepID=A0A2A9NKL5_9AGAR|nr:hypothetical protein AMATHDRAFT_58952 [Amanita thiersii Skay4041]